MKQYISVLNTTLQASGADAVISNGILTITGLQPMTFNGIQNPMVGVAATVAEVSQVDTLTPTAVAAVYYQVNITATNSVTGTQQTWVFTYYLPTLPTATNICDGIRNAINAIPSLPVTATGTTTLILTADAGYAQFTTTNPLNTQSTGVMAIVHTTAGVVAIGTVAALVAQVPSVVSTNVNVKFYVSGALSGSALVTGKTYKSYKFIYTQPLRFGDNSQTNFETIEQFLYVQDDATNFDALIGAAGTGSLTSALASYVTGGAESVETVAVA